MTGKRKTAITALIIFLLFMAVCTLITRGIYASQLPRITVESPSRRSITHTVEVRGSVRQGQEYGIYAQAGLRVAAIFKEKGDSFEEGETLFQIDTEDLKRQIEERQLTVDKLTLQQKDSAAAGEAQRKNQARTLARAKEDYELAVRDGDVRIARARLLYAQAQEELEAYQKKGAPSGNTGPGSSESVSSGDAGSGDSASLQEAWQKELTRLKQACVEAGQAVEDAILAKEDALRSAERSIEDAGEEELKDSSWSQTALDIAYQQAGLQEFQKLYEAGGMVYAKCAGRILDVKLQAGERTNDSAAMLYCLDDGERILDIQLTTEQAKYVETGDTVKLTYNTETGAKKNGEAVISYMEEADGGVTARARLAEKDVQIGQFITCSISKTSENYENCISASSLYSNGMSGYVIYIVEEKEGILGTQSYIRKVDVRVLDQNEKTAAIEGTGISQDVKVAAWADKSFEAGDVVRVVE